MDNLRKLNFSLIFLFLVATLIVFFFSSRFSPLYNFNYWSDINIYYTIGKGICYGKVPYKDLFDHKGPLIFFIYALGYLLHPRDFWGMFAVQVFFQFVSLTYVYKTLCLFTDKNKLALLLSLFIFYFLLTFTLSGGSAEEFIFTFQIVSFFYFIQYFKNDTTLHNPKVMLLHGIMLACVFYIKLNMILFWFFPLLFVFINLLYLKEYKNFFFNLIYLFIGIFLVSGSLILYFLYNNALFDFWEGYIVFNQLYVTQIGFDVKDFLTEFYLQFKKDLFVFTFLFLGVAYFVFSPIIKNKLGRVAILLSFLLMAFFTLPNSLHLHYYLIPLVPFFILSLVAVVEILNRVFKEKDLHKIAFFALFLFSLVFISTRKEFFGHTIKDLYTRNFPETCVEVFSKEINSSDANSLLVLDIGSGLCVFTMLDIVPDAKYFFSPNISHELYPAVSEGHSDYIREGLVKYVIIDEGAYYLDYYNELLDVNYELINRFVSPNYTFSLLYRKK